MRVTVAVCTWNRAAVLERMLRRLTCLAVPDGVEWEVVVVDNGSNDQTPAVLAALRDVLPLRAVEERRAGLSNARNAAVRAASGEYMLWTDDDVLVDEGWLAAYVAAFRRWPTAALFGGPIAPEFDPVPPEWLRAALPHVSNAFALIDLGPEPIRFVDDVLPFGANYAIRMDVQRRHAYDPRLGRCRGRLLAGEETAVASSVLAAGESGWWVPDARVRHVIPAERQTLRYLRSYYFGNSASGARRIAAATLDAQRVVASTSGAPRLLGRPRWVWREAIEYELRYRFHRMLGASSAVWASEFRRATSAWGLLLSSDGSGGPARGDERTAAATSPLGHPAEQPAEGAEDAARGESPALSIGERAIDGPRALPDAPPRDASRAPRRDTPRERTSP